MVSPGRISYHVCEIMVSLTNDIYFRHTLYEDYHGVVIHHLTATLYIEDFLQNKPLACEAFSTPTKTLVSEAVCY